MLKEEIQSILSLEICDKETLEHWTNRLAKGNLTRDDNNPSHFCCYFLPYNPSTKKIFLTLHKKSNLWISPGGHIDKNETLMQTINREIEEELGLKNEIKEKIKPFLITTTPIERDDLVCKEHLDVWYRFPTDGSKFKVDLREFHDVKWLSIEEARKLTTNKQNIAALDKMEKLFNQQI